MTTTPGTGLRALAAAVAALLVLSGCSHHATPYYDTICVDPASQLRMPDSYCQPGLYYHPSWVYYVPFGYRAPGVQQHISNYTVNNYHRPTGATIHTGGVPASGGTASKFKSGNVSVNKPTPPKQNQQRVPAPKPRSGFSSSRVKSGRR